MTNEIARKESTMYNNKDTFDVMARAADAFSKSTIIPKDFQGKAANVLVALDMAQRLDTSPILVMQNLYVINGRPSWSSSFIIATINNSGKYKTELQFTLTGSGDSLACYAWAEDYQCHKSIGPTITMKMAKAEGWLGKNGSKWQTMPEVMIRYRAASFFGRLFCPELIMGIYSKEEVIELDPEEYTTTDTPKEEEVIVIDEVAITEEEEVKEEPNF